MKLEEREQLKKHWTDIVNIGPRFMGTTGEKKAVDYLLNEFQKQGIPPSIHEFNYEGWEINNLDESLTIEYSNKSKVLKTTVLLGSGSTDPGRIEGKLVFLGSTVIWNMYSWIRFGIIDEEDNIIGYVSGRPDGQVIPQTLAEGNSLLPHFSVGQKDTNEILELISQKKDIIVRGYIKSSQKGVVKGKNIAIQLPAQINTNKKVILCAHYDTMFNTVGAYDNTSGTAILLNLAIKLKQLDLKTNVELVFMGGEEWNLAGSSTFASKITDEEKESIELVINIDGIGRGDIFEAWVGPEKVERDVYKFFKQNTSFPLEKLHIKSPPPPGSDHTPFFNAGMPVCMFTINDQEIIHSKNDVVSDEIFNNMTKSFELIIEFLRFKEVIS